MKRIKAFRYLSKRIPMDQFDILSHIVFVVAFLSNIQPPLRDSAVDSDPDSEEFDEDLTKMEYE
jgi:hypothetical protein